MKKKAVVITFVFFLLLSVVKEQIALTIPEPKVVITNLSNNSIFDRSPSISGIGDKVAFVSAMGKVGTGGPDQEIVVINSDGSGFVRLTNNTVQDDSPRISHDGTKIAFIEVGLGIGILNSDGNDFRIFSGGSSPSITANGDKIAFAYLNDIYVVNSDGTELIQLTNSEEIDANPQITADGSRIFFASGYYSNFRIMMINADGTNLQEIPRISSSSISINADGSKIVFVDKTIEDTYEVFIINSDGTELTQVTHTNEPYVGSGQPLISGDGQKIVFTSNAVAYQDLFAINSDGTGLIQITNGSFCQDPTINYDGTKIAFASEDTRGGDLDIYLATIVTSPMRTYTFDAGTWNGTSYSINVESTSNISDFYFNPDEGAFLKLNLTEEGGTTGFCNVTIPKDLLWVEDGWTVLVDDEPIAYTEILEENYTHIHFIYNTTAKTVRIQGTHTSMQAEFPSFLILPPFIIAILFILVTLLAVMIYRRIRISKQGETNTKGNSA